MIPLPGSDSTFAVLITRREIQGSRFCNVNTVNNLQGFHLLCEDIQVICSHRYCWTTIFANVVLCYCQFEELWNCNRFLID
jgi:hypothetical protein